MIPNFGKNIELKINLISDEIILIGTQDEAAGRLLQGTLELKLDEPMKVKAIHLSFLGKMKVSWSEGIGHQQQHHTQEKVIISHLWNFIQYQHCTNVQNHTPCKKLTTLNPGNYSWPFELLLPGHLPQSLSSDIGNIFYFLCATIERPSFIQTTIVRKRTVKISRCVTTLDFDFVQSLEIHNTWPDKIAYDITVPAKVFSFSDTIPISIKLFPIASNLKVTSITVNLKEYFNYKANGHSRLESRIIRLIRENNPFSSASPLDRSRGENWNRTLTLRVPAKQPYIFPNADSDMIRIRHRLKFLVTLSNPDGHVSELRCAVKVIIIESFAISDELNVLPPYREMLTPPDALNTVSNIHIPSIDPNESLSTIKPSEHSDSMSFDDIHPESPSSLPPLNSPSPSNSSSRNHSRRTSIDVDEINDLPTTQEPLWWNGVDLRKVPSYQSINTLNQALFDNIMPPPSYEMLNQLGFLSPDRS